MQAVKTRRVSQNLGVVVVIVLVAVAAAAAAAVVVVVVVEKESGVTSNFNNLC